MTLSPRLRVVAARLISRTGGEAAFFVGIWGTLAYEFEGSPTDIAIVMAALVTSQALGEVAKLGPLAIAPAIAAAVGIQASLAASGLLLVAVAAASWSTATRLDATRTFDVASEVPTAAVEHGSVPHSADPLG